VRLLHELAKIHASFDEPNLVSRAGLVPVMALAQRAGLADLAGEHVRLAGGCVVNAPVKVACVVAGMAAGADSIDDLDVLRHGAMSALFGLTSAKLVRTWAVGLVDHRQLVGRRVVLLGGLRSTT
jgi:hypothetical protein